MFYSTKIFKDYAKLGDYAVYATLALSVANFVQTAVSSWLVEHPWFGRRSLLLIGKFGMLFATILLTVTIHFAQLVEGTEPTAGNKVASYSAVVCLVAFIIFFATGPGSIPFFYVNEVFSSNARASASALATGTNWSCNFIIGLGFPILLVLLMYFLINYNRLHLVLYWRIRLFSI